MFECRENFNSIIESFFDFTDTETTKKSTDFTSKLFFRCCVLDWVHDVGIRTRSRWGLQLWILSELKKVLLGIFGLSRHCCMRHTSLNLPAKKFSTGRFLMPALIEELKLAILVNNEYDYREEKSKGFSLEVSDSQDTDEREKLTDFYLNIRSQVLYSKLRFWWRKLNWWWLTNKRFKIERNEFNEHFFKNLDCNESAARIKTKGLLTQLSSTNGKFSMEILVEEIITVDFKNNELEYPDRSKILNVSEIFWRSGLWLRDRETLVFRPNHPLSMSDFRI